MHACKFWKMLKDFSRIFFSQALNVQGDDLGQKLKERKHYFQGRKVLESALHAWEQGNSYRT